MAGLGGPSADSQERVEFDSAHVVQERVGLQQGVEGVDRQQVSSEAPRLDEGTSSLQQSVERRDEQVEERDLDAEPEPASSFSSGRSF